MNFMIFDVKFCAPNLCVIMGMLNFMELMCLYVQVHSCCSKQVVLVIFAQLSVNHELVSDYC